MGTLGCINDMLQRDKENRELRKLNRDRIKEHQKYLVNKGKGNDLSNISIEQMEEIHKRTIEKEALDNASLWCKNIFYCKYIASVFISDSMLYAIFQINQNNMKTNIILFSLISLLFFSPRMKAQPNTAKHDFTHKENGWYHVLSTGSLSSKPIITVKDFVGLKLEKDYFGKYAISGQISKHKLNKWADETEKSIGKKIAFVFNDSIITAPQVNCRIESGTFMITSFSDQKLLEIYKGIMREKSESLEVVFNGWEKDSLYYELSPEQRDSVRMNIDYWEAKAWIDLISKPEEHYWYSIQDSTEYKKLEKALKEELKKPNFSSRATDYMKSDAYKAYKQYLHKNKDYINLMFQGFLFNNLKGLNGYLVDDIIQSKYPYAPSIRSYIEKTNNVDDEKLAVYEWQRKVWYQMNKEKSPRNKYKKRYRSVTP